MSALKQQFEPQLMDESTVAKLLHYKSAKSIKRLVRAGLIDCYPVGGKRLYKMQFVEDYLETIRVKAKKPAAGEQAGVVDINAKRKGARQ